MYERELEPDPESKDAEMVGGGRSTLTAVPRSGAGQHCQTCVTVTLHEFMCHWGAPQQTVNHRLYTLVQLASTVVLA